jgi:multiple antibiotic resistance protein
MLLLRQEYGLPMTSLALLLNFLIVGLAFRNSNLLIRLLGKGGATAMSKIFTLLLVAIAVRMIRSGVLEHIQNLGK